MKTMYRPNWIGIPAERLEELDEYLAELAYRLGQKAILELQRRALESEDYLALQLGVCAPGAHPLKGSKRVTREIQDSPLFRSPTTSSSESESSRE